VLTPWTAPQQNQYCHVMPRRLWKEQIPKTIASAPMNLIPIAIVYDAVPSKRSVPKLIKLAIRMPMVKVTSVFLLILLAAMKNAESFDNMWS
jgi:hypothetical protein